jgi:prophage maintenance system killer protein
VDGNKRTGTASALVFLDLNRIRIQAPHAALVRLVLGVASGSADKNIKRNKVPVSGCAAASARSPR